MISTEFEGAVLAGLRDKNEGTGRYIKIYEVTKFYTKPWHGLGGIAAVNAKDGAKRGALWYAPDGAMLSHNELISAAYPGQNVDDFIRFHFTTNQFFTAMVRFNLNTAGIPGSLPEPERQNAAIQNIYYAFGILASLGLTGMEATIKTAIGEKPYSHTI